MYLETDINLGSARSVLALASIHSVIHCSLVRPFIHSFIHSSYLAGLYGSELHEVILEHLLVGVSRSAHEDLATIFITHFAIGFILKVIC